MVKQKWFAVFVLVVWPRCCWWGWAAVYRWEDAAQRMGVDMRGAQPTPGNSAGGLTTMEEKSLGAITKGGSTLVQALIGYAARTNALLCSGCWR